MPKAGSGQWTPLGRYNGRPLVKCKCGAYVRLSLLSSELLDDDAGRRMEAAKAADMAAWTKELAVRLHHALCVAAGNGSLSEVKNTLSQGGPLEIADAHVQPLALAAMRGHVEVVQLLLDQGASIDGRDSSGTTALLSALAGKHHQIVRLLLQRRASINIDGPDGMSPLFLASTTQSAELVRLLLEVGADPNKPASDGTTPAMCAAALGCKEMLEQLAAAGARFELSTPMWQKVLAELKTDGSVEILQFIEKHASSCRDDRSQ